MMMVFPSFSRHLVAFIYFTCMLLIFASAEIRRPRGVAISKAALYAIGEQFTCFDGSRVISFSHVNDDYCDCPDASDEPGTSACPNGHFHCTNAGHRPENIPSSRVNDGICDCCDGTDEFANEGLCKDDCIELGREAREERERQERLLERGHAVYAQYVKQGEVAKVEKQTRLEQLKSEKESLEVRVKELEDAKNEVELPEKEAKEEFEKEWQAEKERIQSELDKLQVTDAFDDLDMNRDGLVSLGEMQRRMEFDIDSNGEVSDEEAKEYLEDSESVDADTFRDRVWPNIKELYKSPVEVTTEQPQAPKGDIYEETTTTEAPPIDEEEEAGEIADPLSDIEEGHDDDDYDEYRDDVPLEDEEDEEEDAEDEDDDFDNEQYPSTRRPEVATEAPNKGEAKPEYSDDIKQLIAVADLARGNYDEANGELKKVTDEMRSIDKYMGIDFGAGDAFAAIRGQTFEFTDREYTYKLVPFEKVTQRNKNGGTETSLGKWGRWSGADGDSYSSMLYEKGQNCWNGPDRSVTVLVHCGEENSLWAATEPSRCEYQFQFTTPAACVRPPRDTGSYDKHEEL